MGLATAQLLASRGAVLSLGDLNETALLAAVESLPHNSSISSSSDQTKKKKHMVQVIDVRKSETVDSWIQETVRMFGRLDGAVNMAGVITPACPVASMTDAAWDFVFAVNARGVFSCIRAQVNAMKGGGSIVSCSLCVPPVPRMIKSIKKDHDDVNGKQHTADESELNRQVSAASVFGQMGSPGVAAYCASKAAVIGLVRTAAKENPHVRMNCVAPGK